MPDPIKSTTGKAKIHKVGHTGGKNFGTNERAQIKGSNPTHDLSPK